jgi:hypothetical protein
MTNPPDASAGVRQFERTCTYCGARLAVTIPRDAAAGVLRDYNCPECGKTFEVRSILPPLVRLIAPRNDGKTDSYQETIF